MKIRNGFVSNSSSTSFVIAYKTPEKCKCCGETGFNFFDHIALKVNDKKETYGWFIYCVADEIENIKQEIEECKESKEWLEKTIAEYNKMIESPDVERFASHIVDVIEEQILQTDMSRNSAILRSKIKQTPPKQPEKKEPTSDELMRQYSYKKSGIDGMSSVKREIERMKRALSDFNEGIKSKNKYIKSLNGFSGKEWKVFKLVDNTMDGLLDLIRNLESEGKIQVLLRETT